MSHLNPHHDRENERVEDSKFAPKKKVAMKMKSKVSDKELKKRGTGLAWGEGSKKDASWFHSKKK